MSSTETLEPKRLALAWAQERGFRVAAAEVSVPNLRAVINVAACHVESCAAADRGDRQTVKKPANRG